MDGYIQALLGQWYDVVGPQIGRGMPHRHRRPHRRWQDQDQDQDQDQGQDGYGGYGAYGQQGGGFDPRAFMAYFQMLQQQQQQPQMIPVPVPVPMPQAPVGPPPGAPGAPAPGVSGWYDITGPGVGASGPNGPNGLPFPFPPRAAVVDAPMPTQANRDILPMSTGVPILPTQSAQITGRPQTLVFKIGRFVISNAGTAGGAADWICNDIKIGNRSQFVQSGDVPGDLFATNAIDTFVRFDSAQTAMDVVVVVTYIGLNESGCPFFGAMVGTAAV
jgi:hypothetical protein